MVTLRTFDKWIMQWRLCLCYVMVHLKMLNIEQKGGAIKWCLQKLCELYVTDYW